jgi:hypothetical protein
MAAQRTSVSGIAEGWWDIRLSILRIVAWLLIQAASFVFPKNLFLLQPFGLPTALVRNWSSLFLNRMLKV